MGFAPTDHGLGIIARVSQKQVVNVAQRGGLAAVLVGYRPEDLQELDALARARRRSRREELRARRAAASRSRRRHPSARVGRGDLSAARRRRRPRLAARRPRRRCGTMLLAGDRLGDLLAARRPRATTLTARERVELERLGRLRRAAVALPQSLVAAFAETRSHCLAAWEEARRRDDYARFPAPVRAAAEAHARARAGAAGRATSSTTALLDEHEPGMRRARLEPLLQTTGARLRALVPALARAHAPLRDICCRAAATTRRGSGSFCAALLRDMGFDFARGRLDRSTHPFTMMAGDDDVRLTIRSSARRPAARDLRDAARRRPRALRPGLAARAARHVARRCAEHGHARVAGAALGEPRRAQRARSGGITSPKLQASFPGAARRARRARLSARDQRRRARPESRRRRRGHVQPARARALRARDRVARRRPRRRRSARRLGRALSRLPRRQRRTRRATAACRTCTGRSASSAISRPTRSAISTRRSSSTRTTTSHDLDAELASGNLSALRDVARGACLRARRRAPRRGAASSASRAAALDVEPFFRRLERRVAELE